MLWSAVFITISTLYRPVEQLLSPPHLRAAAPRRADRPADAGRLDDPARPRAAASRSLALALRGPIQDDLLEGNETLYWVFFSAVLFYAASYFARGFLAGSAALRPLRGADPLRVVLPHDLRASLVAVGLLSGQSAVAIGIIAAPALSLIVVPFAFARRAKQERGRRPASRRDARAPARGVLASPTAAASPRRCC